MAINQFAKISPVVNSNGFLLQKDSDGNYTIVSTVRLKENETGICIEDNSILVMFEGNPVKLRGGMFNNMSDALNYVSNNKTGEYDGQLVNIKSNPNQLYVIIGNQLYNLTENTQKTIVINMPTNSSDNIFNIIENSTMQENYSKKYLITNVDAKIPGSDYTFYNESNKTIKYPVIILNGSIEGSTEIEINDSCYANITRCVINSEFKGKLKISMKSSNLDDNAGNIVTKYRGNQILLIVTYVPLTLE